MKRALLHACVYAAVFAGVTLWLNLRPKAWAQARTYSGPAGYSVPVPQGVDFRVHGPKEPAVEQVAFFPGGTPIWGFASAAREGKAVFLDVRPSGAASPAPDKAGLDEARAVLRADFRRAHLRIKELSAYPAALPALFSRSPGAAGRAEIVLLGKGRDYVFFAVTDGPLLRGLAAGLRESPSGATP